MTSTDRILLSAFALTILALAGIGVLSYRSTEKWIAMQSHVGRTHTVLEKLDGVLLQMLRSETATRAFVISGAEPYSRERLAALGRLNEDSAAVRRLISGDLRQRRLFDEVSAEIAEKVAFEARKIDLVRKGSRQAALDDFLSGLRAGLTGQIGARLTEMKENEQSLLAQRTAQAKADTTASIYTLVAGWTMSSMVLAAIFFLLNREIRKRRLSESRLRRSNQLYAMLSQTNEAIVRARDRRLLLGEVARIAVEQGFFAFAWLGIVDDAGNSLDPCVVHGRAPGEGAWSRRVPAEKQFSNDLVSAPGEGPWSRETVEAGFRSAAVLPIRIGTNHTGVFGLLSTEPAVFDSTVLRLLDEIASDLAFALEHMDKEDRRRAAEEELRKQAQIIDEVHDSIISTDMGGRVTAWNRGAEMMTGYTAGEALGRHISFLYPSDQHAFLRDGVIAPLLAAGIHDTEVRMRKKSGDDFYAHISLTLQRGADGRPFGMIGYSIDITEAKRSEQALRESEERFRQMAESIQEVFWLADARSRKVLYLSPAYERAWGRPVASVRGKGIAALLESVHPDDRPRVRHYADKLMRGEPYSHEYRILLPDGTERWMWDQGFPIRDQAGEVYRLAGIAQDVTSRKRAELEIRSRVAQLRAVAELGQQAVENTGMMELLESTVERVRSVLAVDYCKILELMPGGSVFELRAGSGWKRDGAPVAVAADIESQAGYTLRCSTPVVVSDLAAETRFRAPALLMDHGVKSGASVIIGDEQRPYGVLGVHSRERRSFTEDDVHFLQSVANILAATLTRKRAEEEILHLNGVLEARVAARTAELAVLNRELALRNGEVERANRLKSEFLASMSHELRTPLNAIIGFTDLMMRGKGGTLNEKHRQFMAHVQRGARHLLQLINDILDLSKIEAGRVEIEPQAFPLADALREVLPVITPLAANKSIEIASDVPADSVVFAERIRFKQIIFNLLSNAVKFTPERGRVWLECSSAPGGVEIAVCDTGIGIPAEEQESVFEEFHQAGPTTRGVKEGTGLGLAITRRLVELHGGRIRVVSTPGAGSRFLFTLPAAPAAAGSAVIGP